MSTCIMEIWRSIDAIVKCHSRQLLTLSKQYDLSVAELRILLRLYMSPAMTPTQLAHTVAADSPSISRGIKKLLCSGYIRKETNAADYRSYRLFMSRKGFILAKKITEQLEQTYSVLMSEEMMKHDMLVVGLLQKLSLLLKESLMRVDLF